MIRVLKYAFLDTGYSDAVVRLSCGKKTIYTHIETLYAIRRVQRLMSARSEMKRDDIIEVGEAIFSTLFQGDALEFFEDIHYRWSMDKNEILAIKIDCNVLNLPWEMMAYRHDFLATSPRTWISRSQRGIAPPANITRPRVLVIAPNADDLNIETELDIVEGVLEGKGLPYFCLDGVVGIEDVVATLSRNGPFDTIHFLGHGKIGIVDSNVLGYLRFNGERGAMEWVDANRVASIFKAAPTVQLVILNACQTAVATTSSDLDDDSISAVADTLTNQGVPSVIAMQLRIRDDVALDFSETFYQSLVAGGATVPQALAWSRCFIAAKHPDSLGFATPVLYENYHYTED